MKRSTLSACILLLGAYAQASDMFMPIAANQMQAGLSANYFRIQDTYNADGESYSIDPALGNDASISSAGVAAFFTYGVVPQADLTVKIPFHTYSRDTDLDKRDGSGLNKPQIIAKYGLSKIGIAGFLELHLPFGTEEIVGAEPQTTGVLGVLMERQDGAFLLRGDIQYHWVPEHDDWDEANDLTFAARPGFEVQPGLFAELDLNYNVAGESAWNGRNVENSDYSRWTIAPGALWKFDEVSKAELLIPYTISGSNVEGGFGIWLQVMRQL